MIGLIITGPIGLVMIIMGIVLLSGRGGFLIAGYNTKTKAEKEKYDEVALCKFIGKIVLIIAVMTILMGIEVLVTSMWFWIVWSVVFVAVITFSIIYANTKNRFKK